MDVSPVPQSVQVALLAAPALDEYFPASQSVQAAAPALEEYFPATHMVHPDDAYE